MRLARLRPLLPEIAFHMLGRKLVICWVPFAVGRSEGRDAIWCRFRSCEGLLLFLNP